MALGALFLKRLVPLAFRIEVILFSLETGFLQKMNPNKKLTNINYELT